MDTYGKVFGLLVTKSIIFILNILYIEHIYFLKYCAWNNFGRGPPPIFQTIYLVCECNFEKNKII